MSRDLKRFLKKKNSKKKKKFCRTALAESSLKIPKTVLFAIRTSDVSGMWVPDRPSKTVWLAERTSKALRNSQFQAIIVAAFCLGPESELVIFSLLLKKQFGMWHD